MFFEEVLLNIPKSTTAAASAEFPSIISMCETAAGARDTFETGWGKTTANATAVGTEGGGTFTTITIRFVNIATRLSVF